MSHQQRKVSNLYQNMTAEGSDFYGKYINNNDT